MINVFGVFDQIDK